MRKKYQLQVLMPNQKEKMHHPCVLYLLLVLPRGTIGLVQAVVSLIAATWEGSQAKKLW